MSSPDQRKLTIQLGVCRRMMKEVASYEKEVLANEAILQKMRDDERHSLFYCLYFYNFSNEFFVRI